jgi:hypothetical protein
LESGEEKKALPQKFLFHVMWGFNGLFDGRTAMGAMGDQWGANWQKANSPLEPCREFFQ